MSEISKEMIAAARDAFYEKCGITIFLPDEGSMDDFERERFEGLKAALEAALSVFRAIGEGSRVPSPHEYAMEYEFRGDGDYTPTDAERTMIEDAICGYLGEVSALRSPPEPGRDAPEPVAWRYRDEKWSEEYWHYFTKEPRHKEPNEIWEPLYRAPPPDGELVRKAEAFDRIVAARKRFVDATAAYNARLEFVRDERQRGNWLNVDREYAALSEAQSAYHRTVQELSDRAALPAKEGQSHE